MSDDSSKNKLSPCPTCHAGHIGLHHVAYFTWLSGELITVPDFPAWICDVCGMREYDHQALSWLNIILSPDTGNKRHPMIKPKTRLPESPPIQPEI